MTSQNIFTYNTSQSQKSKKSLQSNVQPLYTNTEIKQGKQDLKQQLATTKKITLLSDCFQKHSFPVVRDRDIGIGAAYQNIVIESYNDDDKRTSSTQLEKGMTQTVQDLYDILQRRKLQPNTQHI